MRLIDADAYAAELWEMRQNYQMLDDTQTADKIMYGLYRAEQALKDAPTIDAVPVIHAYWKDSDWIQGMKTCANCGVQRNPKFKIGGGAWLYCPNCGAKMDGKPPVDSKKM